MKNLTIESVKISAINGKLTFELPSYFGGTHLIEFKKKYKKEIKEFRESSKIKVKKGAVVAIITTTEKEHYSISKELHNSLVDMFEARASHLIGNKNGFKNTPSKKYLELQCEFFAGAITALDAFTGNEKSCISPLIYVSLMRGDKINKL